MASVVKVWAGCAKQPGLVHVQVLVVDPVAQFVQDRLHPPLVVLEVAQDPHVALAVDVRAEGVGVLALPLVEVAAGQDRLDRQADPVVEGHGKLLDVPALVVDVQVQVIDRRRLLEERVLVVPGPHLTGLDAVSPGQA